MRVLTLPTAVVVALAMADLAHAAPEAVPAPPIVADGTTPVTLRFVAPGATRARVKADAGKVGPVTVANGVITAQYTPPLLTAPRSLAFTVTADGESASVQLPAVPGYAGALELSVEPSVVLPGATALVRIRPRGETPVGTAQRRFLAAVSSGTIEAPMPAGDGTWIARYTPAWGVTAPQPVLVAVVDGAAPDAIAASTVVPVAVKRSLTFDVKPGSENVLTVGERPYGPVKAAPSGKVAFDVEVDPRTPTGVLKSVNPDTSREERTVNLPAGVPQALLAPGAGALPSGAALPVRAWAVDGTGAPLRGAPTWTASSGAVTDSAVAGNAYTAVLRGGTGDTTLTLEAGGARAERRVRAAAPLASVSLRADVDELARGATRMTVEARAKDAAGGAVVGRPPAIATSVGSVGPARDNRDGSYTWVLTLPSTAPAVQVSAVATAEATGLPASRLLAWTDTPEVAANGRDEAVLTIVAVDALGMPVPGVALKLAAPRGDGRIAPSATTDARGIARVTYTAGSAPGVAGIRVEGAGLTTEVALWQAAGANAGVGSALANVDGDPLLAAWRGAAPQLRVAREGAAPVAGPPATATVTTVPAFTTPGAAILVSVRVVDAAGKGVAGRKLSVNAAPATVGKVTDARDGTYTFTAQLPPGVDGPLTVTVVADGATGVVQLPTFAQAGAAGAGPDTPRETRRAKTEKMPSGPRRTGPSLRYGVTLTNTRGSYAMTSEGGAQLVEDAAYDAPAAGFFGGGGELAWRVASPGFGDLLLDVRASASAEPFRTLGLEQVNVQRDAIAGVRVVRPAGPVRVAAGVAAHYTTGVIFRYADAALTEPTQLNVPLYGARVSIGAEAGNDRMHARLEFAESFAPAPIATHLGLLVDIGRADALAIRAGASMEWRDMTFVAGDGSEANVTQTLPAARVGVAWTR
jgi:hypothetical protein